jgi:hypothetical protein
MPGYRNHVRRLHLFEWEDQPWLPAVFRNFITEHLRYTLNEQMRKPINLAIGDRLKRISQATERTQIVDLCSGAGGPLPWITRLMADELGYPVQVTLTDLYPNTKVFERIASDSAGRIKACAEPVSAWDVPRHLDGIRTMFTAFHHFRPEQGRLVLADAARKGAPLAIFEPLERSVRGVAIIGLMSLLRGFTHTPRLGNLTFGRFMFTYVLPLCPLLLAWDGVVSCLRTYTPSELADLAGKHDGYQWESGRFDVESPFGPLPTTYLIGVPKQAAASPAA